MKLCLCLILISADFLLQLNAQNSNRKYTIHSSKKLCSCAGNNKVRKLVFRWWNMTVNEKAVMSSSIIGYCCHSAPCITLYCVVFEKYAWLDNQLLHVLVNQTEEPILSIKVTCIDLIKHTLYFSIPKRGTSTQMRKEHRRPWPFHVANPKAHCSQTSLHPSRLSSSACGMPVAELHSLLTEARWWFGKHKDSFVLPGK